MASPGLSEIVTTTLRNRSKKLADNMLRNNGALVRLNSRGNVKPFSGGRTIVQELEYANNSTYKRYSGYETLNIQPSDVFTAAEYAIRQAAVAVSISGLEMLQNSGKEAVIDLLESRIKNAEKTFMNGLAYDVYSNGSLTGQIGGLQFLVASSPSTGVVGGIDRATWSFWQNITYSALTNGGAALTSANVYSYMLALYTQLIRQQDRPDLILASDTAWRAYNESLHAIQRITSTETDVAMPHPRRGWGGAPIRGRGSRGSAHAGVHGASTWTGSIPPSGYTRVVNHWTLPVFFEVSALATRTWPSDSM